MTAPIRQYPLPEALITIDAQHYHGSDAYGHSFLLKVLKNPEKARYALESTPEETAALAIGRAIHEAILEPDLFSQHYGIVNESLLEGSLSSLEEMRAAADQLGINYRELKKNELKDALKLANPELTFKDDIQSDLDGKKEVLLSAALLTADACKAAAESLGIATNLKKNDLIAAIKAADSERRFVFREDVDAEISRIASELIPTSLQSLEDYKAEADRLGVRYDAMNKDQLKAAIKMADNLNLFRFRDEEYDRLFGEKIVLKADDADTIEGIRRSISRNSDCRMILAKGRAELSYFWTDPETGIPCRIRPDWIIQDIFGRIIGLADLKTTDDASKEGFRRSVEKYGYDLQAAFYVDAIKQLIGRELPFFFIAVEKKAPHSVAVYRADDEMLETGRNPNSRRSYRFALNALSWCLENQCWPGYQAPADDLSSIETIGLSDYAMRKAYEPF